MALADRADLINDLTYLRKAAGLTLERLANAPAVIDYCGGRDVPLSTVRTRLITAVHALKDHQGGLALAVVYGIDASVGGEDADARRAAYAEVVKRTPGTLREWENGAIAEIALILITSYYAGSETPRGVVIPHGGYLLEDLHIVTVIRDRVFFESHQTRTILSLVDGAKGFRYGTYSPTELFNVRGAEADPPETHPGGTMHTIRFPKPLNRGQSYTFSFRERVPEGASDGSAGPDSDFSGQTFESPTLRYRIEICFLGEVPETVWTYDKLARIERPGLRTTANTVRMNGHATVGATFSEIYGGLCSGAAWHW